MKTDEGRSVAAEYKPETQANKSAASILLMEGEIIFFVQIYRIIRVVKNRQSS